MGETDTLHGQLNWEYWKSFWKQSLAKPTEHFQASQGYNECEITLSNTRNTKMGNGCSNTGLKEKREIWGRLFICEETRMKKQGIMVDEKQHAQQKGKKGGRKHLVVCKPVQI